MNKTTAEQSLLLFVLTLVAVLAGWAMAKADFGWVVVILCAAVFALVSVAISEALRSER